MNSKILVFFAVAALSSVIAPSLMDIAFAQYMGNVGGEGQTGAYTLRNT